ncbi:thioredoxin-like protein [Lineolata rhizophorae]|uniref:Glutathione S-transferase kappa n=1 Tax=Lineolata rhizophorae TaxID=578093 RepID=A0A6A6NTJ2_9PEZI|nr:thioredoxin-like protein [Lineolata rhizophorae]
MATPKITLYFDIVSPFAYMAFYALRNFPVFSQCEITYVPIFLGGLFRTCGNTTPIEIKNKDRWIQTERLRWSRLFSIPMLPAPPRTFPTRTLPTQRALTALLHSPLPTALSSSSAPAPGPAAALPAAAAALYDALWARDRNVGDAAVLLEVLAGVPGVGGEAGARALVEERAASKEVKEGLVRATQRAFDEGAFGVPWIVDVGKGLATNAKGETEGFFGFDHLGQVIDFLGLERPASRGWKAMM